MRHFLAVCESKTMILKIASSCDIIHLRKYFSLVSFYKENVLKGMPGSLDSFLFWKQDLFTYKNKTDLKCCTHAQYTRVALKVIPSMLLYLLTTWQVNIYGLAVEIEPASQ